jgi:hypothetical protein
VVAIDAAIGCRKLTSRTTATAWAARSAHVTQDAGVRGVDALRDRFASRVVERIRSATLAHASCV